VGISASKVYFLLFSTLQIKAFFLNYFFIYYLFLMFFFVDVFCVSSMALKLNSISRFARFGIVR
jgi:hypothetical protein